MPPNLPLLFRSARDSKSYQCRHLGVMICTKNCDIDLKRQMKKFYANSNILSRKFAKCSPDVKCTLFKSFCSNMYCSTMWYNGTVTAMRKLRIAYNNSLRRLLGIPKYNSASEMFVRILVSICDSSVPIFSNIWNWWYVVHCSITNIFSLKSPF